MTTVTENDLREIKNLIIQLSERTDNQYKQLNQKINDLTLDVAVMKETLVGVNKRFDDVNISVNKRFDDINISVNKRFDDVNISVNKRFDDVNKRLDDWKPQITKAIDKTDNVAEKMSILSEKVGELKNWRQVAIIVITGLITTLFWLLRDGRF
ncbi:hypothetical protein VKI21_02240 [Cyanobacterium aponinum UTEX 3222]|uniref:hypothetical protein n=1 Tax=Cyanobacterium aponinum TaxID=379064 RepID=UPI003088DBCF|nr:hypothetical protein VKI21_02240 [Cyanobacterium aponinum UTEX 3222]